MSHPVSAWREARWLDRRRIVAYAAILLALETAAILLLAAASHGALDLFHGATTTDFASFYAAGRLAGEGRAALVYDQATHWLTEERARGYWGFAYLRFYYPPIFMLLCLPLARLPYLAAFAVWVGGTGAAYLATVRAIVGRAVPILPFAAYAPVFLELGTGQNAFLTAALFGAATLLVDRRPAIAGLLFGALCYKPHFGLFVPLALLAAGNWRAILGAAVSVLALAGLSALVFGIDTWAAFLALSRSTADTFAEGYVNFAALISPFAAVRLMGGGIALAWAVHATVALFAAVQVARVWRQKHQPLAVRAATLIAATLASLPVILFYDLVLGGVAIAWLARDAQRTGFLPWEKATLAALFIAPILVLGLGQALHLPLGPVIALALLGLALRRAGWSAPARDPGGLASLAASIK